jgi:integrase
VLGPPHRRRVSSTWRCRAAASARSPRATSVVARFWRPATRAAGLEGVRVHDLRHTTVPCGSRRGPAPVRSPTRAGHTSVSFTLDRYGHLYPEADRALRDRLDRIHEAPGDD